MGFFVWAVFICFFLWCFGGFLRYVFNIVLLNLCCYQVRRTFQACNIMVFKINSCRVKLCAMEKVLGFDRKLSVGRKIFKSYPAHKPGEPALGHGAARGQAGPGSSRRPARSGGAGQLPGHGAGLSIPGRAERGPGRARCGNELPGRRGAAPGELREAGKESLSAPPGPRAGPGRAALAGPRCSSCGCYLFFRSRRQEGRSKHAQSRVASFTNQGGCVIFIIL